jgi:hypothetical protein
MARKILIEFERGGRFTAELLEERAPTNADMLWSLLPIETKARHGRWSGEAFYCKDERLRIAHESPQVVGVEPGSIALEMAPAGVPGFSPGIIFVYGWKFAFKTAYTPEGTPVFLVARIHGDLDAFSRIGPRLLMDGEEGIRIHRAE